MCRLMAYIGPPALVADVVLWPDRSIIKQSYDARERIMDSSLPQHLAHGNLNGDGFGIGWFSPEGATPRNDPTPCTFTSITPAWNNENLGRLSCKITSPLVFAHVRAAYPGMPVSEQNCHPFQWGMYLFMHNGVIANFMRIRRTLLATLSEQVFNTVQSFHSDSALAFALFLNNLPDLQSRLQPAQLLAAIEATVADITRVQQEAGETSGVSLLNFVVSDGQSLVATRYVDRDECAAATMYFAEGAAFRRVSDVAATNGGTQAAEHSASMAATPTAARETSVADEAEYTLTYGERGSRVVLVASEPITGSAGHWVAVPRNTALVVSRGKAGLLDVVQAPLAAGGVHPRQLEVQQCLEAISQSVHVSARPWTGAPLPLGQQHGHSPSLPPLSSAAMMAAMPSESLDTLPVVNGHGGDGGGDVQPVSPRKRRRRHVSFDTAQSNGAMASDNAAVPEAVTSEEHRLTGHAGSVLCARVFCGHLLFSGSVDGTLKVWDLKTCKCVGTLLRAAKPVAHLELAAGRLYAAAGRRVFAWTLPCLTPVASVELSRERGRICSLCVGPRETVYVGLKDTGLQAFKLPLIMDAPSGAAASGAPAAKLATIDEDTLPGGGVETLWASEVGNGSSSTLDIYATSSGAVPPAAVADGTAAEAAVIGTKMRDGHWKLPPLKPLLAKCASRSAHTQPAPGSQLDALSFEGLPMVTTPIAVADAAHGHCCSVNAIARCTGYVCSGGGDAAIRVWRARTLEPVSVLRGHRGAILTMFAMDNLLLSGGRDNTVRVWDMEALVCRRTLTGHKDDVLHITGLRLSDPSAEPPSAIGEREPSPPPEPGLGVLFATASADGCVRLWRSRCWTCIRVFACSAADPTAPPCPFLSAAMTEKYTITGSSDGVIRLWASAEPFQRARTRPPASSASSEEAPDVDSAAVVQGGAKRQKVLDDGGGALPDRIGGELERALRDFVRLATVSRDPGHREDCFRGAKFLGTLLESLGAEIKMAHGQEDRNPVVLGRLGRDPAKPTVCFYGHYDVQPAMERDWKTDPFQLHSIDGYFYARGASDNKGPILAFVYAVKELLGEGRPGVAGPAGSLPCNVVFVVEGEEENGSAGFREVLRSNKRWFEGVSLVVISNTLWVGERVPCLTYGMRGMISLSIEVAGPQRDLHSGNDGGVFNEPLADLTKVLASLIDSRNNIQVPGFYDGVREGMLDAAVSRLEASDEFQLPAYQDSLGVPSFVSNTSQRDLLSARWCEPSLSVVDVRVGDDTAAGDADDAEGYRFGPTRFSVVPRSATGHVSIRFVPDQDASRLFELFRAHVQHEFRKLRSANRVAVRLRSVGDWYEADPASRLFSLAERAVEAQWGRPPLYVREGGTMPVASALEQELGAHALLIPFGQASDACHLANERISRDNLLAGKNVIKHLLSDSLLHQVVSS